MSDFQEFIERDAGLMLKQLAEPEKWEQLVACLVVLVEVALTDKLYDADEYQCMIDLLVKQVGLQDKRAHSLVGFAEQVRQQKSTKSCLSFVNKHFDVRGRQLLYAAVWKVIKADGRVDAAELSAASRLGERLELTTDQEIEARRMVIEGVV